MLRTSLVVTLGLSTGALIDDATWPIRVSSSIPAEMGITGSLEGCQMVRQANLRSLTVARDGREALTLPTGPLDLMPMETSTLPR